MGFSRDEYWSGLPCPPPGDLPNPGIEPESLMFPALAGRFFTTSATWEAQISKENEKKKNFFLRKKKVKKEKIWESGRGSNRDYSQPSGD